MANDILLMDGVIYQEWTPPNEEALADLLREDTEYIFGPDSFYFGDLKKRLKSGAGAGSIPDGWAVVFGGTPQAYAVEIEHSSHDVYGHISPQVDKIVAGVKNAVTQNSIIDAIYNEITRDPLLHARVKDKIGSQDLHKLLSDSVSKQQPQIVIIIDKVSSLLSECVAGKAVPIKIVEFRTFCRQGVRIAVHQHLFEPIAAIRAAPPPKPPQPIPEGGPPPPPPPLPDRAIRVTIGSEAWSKYGLIPFPTSGRRLFPGFKVPFELETDIGVIQAHVTSARRGTPMGDPDAGVRIQSGRRPRDRTLLAWFRRHPQIGIGSQLLIEVLEPQQRYRLTVVEPQ